MGKKQRERKERKEKQKRPGVAPPTWANGEVSPTARKIMDALGRGELFRTETQLFDLVTRSDMLLDEPEFEDYAFDATHVTAVVAPIIEEHKAELEQARASSEDEYNAVYDEIRIEAIDTLLSQARRREFLNLYDEMLRRLLAGDEVDKIQVALVTRSIFDQKEFPWGLTGILVALFEQAHTSVANNLEMVQDLVVSSLKKQHPELTDEQARAMLQDIEKLEELLPEIEFTSEQSDELNEMADEILDDFERSLYSGTVPVDLFTDDELAEVAERMNAITAQADLQSFESETRHMEAVARMLQAYIGEVMTPERQIQLKTDLTTIIGEWQAAGIESSVLLEMERDSLDQVELAENQFIYAALVGQLRRASDEIDEGTIENAEGEPDRSVIDGEVIDSRDSPSS